MNMFDIMLAKKLAGGGSGPAPTLIEKNIDANGDYLASADNADGFSKVSVDVQPNLITKNITNNGTYQASSDSADGYSSVVVNVSSSNYDITGNFISADNVIDGGSVSINIPEGVTGIGESAFEGCKMITSLSLPSSLKTISANAFKGIGIKSLVLPELTTFGDYAFRQCMDLETLDGGNAVFTGAAMFYSCTSLKSADLSEISSNAMGYAVFQGCTSLEIVILPSGLTTISTNVFNACTALKSISLPSGLKSIGSNSFQNSGLETIDVPDQVNVIDARAFMGCTSLHTIVLGASVPNLTNQVLSGCTSLMSLTLKKSSVMSVGTNSLMNVPDNCAIYVPTDLVDTYKANSQWSARADYIHAIPA